MKALVLTDLMKFEYKDVPDPEILNSEDVRIRVMACGICGSDVHGIDGSSGRRHPPVIMGHEASGIIESVGSEVSGFAIGDRVTFDSTIYCGKCDFCCEGRINLCNNRRVIGVSCDEYHRDGAMAELVVVPGRILYKLPETVSFEHAAMVEPVSVAVHAVNRTPIKLGDTAVVMGCGVIGILIIESLRASGCGAIIAVDIDDTRLEMARKLGADVICNSRNEDVIKKIKELTKGRGADIGFEAVGITSTIELGIETLRKGGIFCLVGNISPSIELKLQNVVTREINMLSSCASSGEYSACLDLMGRNIIDVSPLLSAIPDLSEGGEWFMKLYNREPNLIKVVLNP